MAPAGLIRRFLRPTSPPFRSPFTSLALSVLAPLLHQSDFCRRQLASPLPSNRPETSSPSRASLSTRPTLAGLLSIVMEQPAWFMRHSLQQESLQSRMQTFQQFGADLPTSSTLSSTGLSHTATRHPQGCPRPMQQPEAVAPPSSSNSLLRDVLMMMFGCCRVRSSPTGNQPSQPADAVVVAAGHQQDPMQRPNQAKMQKKSTEPLESTGNSVYAIPSVYPAQHHSSQEPSTWCQAPSECNVTGNSTFSCSNTTSAPATAVSVSGYPTASSAAASRTPLPPVPPTPATPTRQQQQQQPWQHEQPLPAESRTQDAPGSTVVRGTFPAAVKPQRRRPLPEVDPLSVTMAVRDRKLDSVLIPWHTLQVNENHVLGTGGFGDVFGGTWMDATQVAVKVMHSDKVTSEMIHMLHQEAYIMCDTTHPYVARTYGFVNDGVHHALVMKLYNRGSLSEAMLRAEYQFLSVSAKLKIALQVACGMRILHERKPNPIIHGDLKTSNLLIENDGNSVVIADFGLAACLRRGQLGHVVENGAMTLTISPPEVLADPTAPRTTAGDVYAFGITLLEIITGQKSFSGMTRDGVTELVLSGGRPAIPVSVPPEVASIIRDCWAQQPQDRPSFDKIFDSIKQAMAVRSASMEAGLTLAQATGGCPDWTGPATERRAAHADFFREHQLRHLWRIAD